MIERIEEIFRQKGLTPSKFADEIGVQRSNVSHVMSGRNKPSLDFIQKILDKYPEISADWLLKGQGEYNDKRTLFDATDNREERVIKGINDSSDEKKKDEEMQIITNINEYKKKIRKIIILYEDNGFEEIVPEK